MAASAIPGATRWCNHTLWRLTICESRSSPGRSASCTSFSRQRSSRKCRKLAGDECWAHARPHVVRGAACAHDGLGNVEGWNSLRAVRGAGPDGRPPKPELRGEGGDAQNDEHPADPLCIAPKCNE